MHKEDHQASKYAQEFQYRICNNSECKKLLKLSRPANTCSDCIAQQNLHNFNSQLNPLINAQLLPQCDQKEEAEICDT